MNEIINDWKQLKRKHPDCIGLKAYILSTIECNMHFNSLERVFVPVFVCDELVQFTNYCFNENSSGDEYFIVIVKGVYRVIKYGYEPDCDGAYHYMYLLDYFPNFFEGFTFTEVCSKDVFDILK